MIIINNNNNGTQSQQEMPSVLSSHVVAQLSPSLSPVLSRKSNYSDKGFFVLFLLISSAGIVAFRQHLQNLARTKGILELNKVQLLYEQMGSEEEPSLTSAATQLQELINSPAQVKQKSSSSLMLWGRSGEGEVVWRPGKS